MSEAPNKPSEVTSLRPEAQRRRSPGIESLRDLLTGAIDKLDVKKAESEVAPFVKDRRALEVWSQDFFKSLVGRITPNHFMSTM